MDYSEFIAHIRSHRWSVRMLRKRGEQLNFSAEQVIPDIAEALSSRDAYLLEALIHLAAIHPDKAYTPVLCKVLEDPSPPLGAAESALEALGEMMDPASFRCLVEVASRPGLSSDSTDWRKALLTIFGFFYMGLLDAEKVRSGLAKIVTSGNELADEATEYLQRLDDLTNRAKRE